MRADARRNYERLLAAARDAYTEHGVEAALDDIAKRAAVGPGTLYRHFPNREALLGAVYRDDVDRLVSKADELLATCPVEEAFRQYLAYQLDYIKQMRGLGAAIKAMLSTDSETLDWCKTTMRGAMGKVLERAQAEGIIRQDVTSADVVRLVHGVGMAVQATPEEADHLLAIVIDGLRARPAP
jgi:AcrR family transcriptional regulator